MTWLRRGREETPPPAPEPPEPDADDSPDALRRQLWELVQLINRSAGRLPVAAVVTARETTDLIREFIETAADGELDVYAVVAVKGIVGDYLPTTLHAYLNLDGSRTDRAGPSGRTAKAALIEQLDALAAAADDLLQASRSHDVDALFTQGNFLRTKFTGSDLDL